MARTLHSNNTIAFLLAAITTSATGIVLQSGQGNQFPEVTASDPDGFWITIEDRSRGLLEICYCTARVGDSLTILRAQQGTTAMAFEAGTSVSNRLTAQFLNDFYDAIEDSAENSAAAAAAAAAALVKANEAQGTANAAQATANAAQAGVSGAVSTADAANAKADAAVTTANQAYGVANTALSTASSVSSVANEAAADASEALTKANEALFKANSAVQPNDLGTAAYHDADEFVTHVEYDPWKASVIADLNNLFVRVAALEAGGGGGGDDDYIVEAGIVENGILEDPT